MTKGKPQHTAQTSQNLKPSITVRQAEEIQCDTLEGLSFIDDSIPFFKQVLSKTAQVKSLNLDTGKKIIGRQPYPGNHNTFIMSFRKDDSVEQVLCYEKQIALMDPYRWMKENERPRLPFVWSLQHDHTVSPDNQGYIDIVASYLADKIGETLHSPHFTKFHGCFRAVTSIFYYNLEDDFEEFRFTRWFWKGLEEGRFDIQVREKESGKLLTKEQIYTLLKPEDDLLTDTEYDSEDDEEDEQEENDVTSVKSEVSAESLSEPILEPATPFYSDLEEAKSIDTCDDEGIEQIPFSNATISSDSSTDSFLYDYTLHAKLFNMPVALLYGEKLDGTLDELLETKQYAPIKTTEQEEIWSAWLFQVCVALAQLQNVLSLTHNDLHTNNILWKKTTEEYLYYKDASNRFWKVPTYGRIFKVIDYGRAIFNINNFYCISSDYKDGNDACGMYNFGTIHDRSQKQVLPNRSFDLARLSCSMLRSLFPQNPDAKSAKASILTKEDDWIVRETNSQLFNTLWSWLKNDNGETILETEEGYEKYPGFDLYIVIAQTAHQAIPAEQFKKKIFSQFVYKQDDTKTFTFIPL